MMTECILFRGTPTKMKLISNGLCYGPCPLADQEIEQRITITPTHIWVSRYDYGEGMPYKLRQRFDGRIARENGEAILRAVGDYFKSSDHILPFATDVGEWELILTNENNEEFRFEGSLIPLDTVLDEISSDMRERLDMPFLYLFNGEGNQDKIDRITIEYSRVTKYDKPKDLSDADYDYITWDYSEKLTIDRETETIEYFRKIGSECDTTWKYHVNGGVEQLLDETDADMFEDIEGNPSDAMDNPKESKTYTITIDFAHLPSKTISGSFDRRGLPTEWASFANDLREFLLFYGEGELLDRRFYEAQKLCPGDIIYLSVTFGDTYKTYYYKTEDNSIDVGDLVVVPVGTDGKERIVKVVKKEYFQASSLPMPFEKVKAVIEKLIPPAVEGPAIDCPVLKKKISVDECYDYCCNGFDVHTDTEAEQSDARCEKCRYYAE